MRLTRLLVWMLLLLPSGCKHYRDPSLIEAAQSGNTSVIEALLARGADVNAKSDRGVTALIAAVRGGCVPAVETLLNHGANPNLRGGSNGWTPLLHAIHNNQLDTARALLDGGASVDGRSRAGETPLMMAAGYGYTPLVELLLDRGADPHAVSPDGSNALAMALTGVPDIDHFTLGSCQAQAVLLLKRRYPDLRLPDNLWMRVAQVAGGVARLRGCAY